MPSVDLDGITISYDVEGSGPAVLLVPGLGEPAAALQFTLAPPLVAAGYQAVTMDNRGVAPSSSPPAPYRIADMAADVLGVLDALGLERAVVAGHSLGGWIAETLAVTHAERLRGAVLMGSANESTSYERASLALAREIAASGLELPAAYSAIETLHYLPQRQLGDDDVVDFWLELLNGAEWANPGKLGQLDAALEWVGASSRRAQWETIAVPCLVLAFEFDIDSPPGRAAEAAAAMPGARFVCLEGAGHLGPLTHTAEVADLLVGFLSSLAP
jgi:pimeloyl-ACP methyl ester carboxylesterase